jgi:hypothetical protein
MEISDKLDLPELSKKDREEMNKNENTRVCKHLIRPLYDLGTNYIIGSCPIRDTHCEGFLKDLKDCKYFE